MRDPRLILNASHAEKRPSCFQSDSQYREYMGLKRLSRVAHLFQGVCHDCTPEFKEQMLTLGKCDHPETIFVQSHNHWGEPETVGVANNHKWWPLVMKGQYVFRSKGENDDGEDQ